MKSLREPIKLNLLEENGCAQVFECVQGDSYFFELRLFICSKELSPSNLDYYSIYRSQSLDVVMRKFNQVNKSMPKTIPF